jgi:YhgE/Pip-like protein
MSEPGAPPSEPARASDVFKLHAVWLPPVVIVVGLVFVMTLVYFGSVVNPSAHLHGLPVVLVNSDAGKTVRSRHVNLGRQVAAALTQSPQVTDRLSVRETTLGAAKDRMDRGKAYVTVVIPPGFTASTLARSEGVLPASRAPSPSRVELLTNSRAGTLGVSLALGVLQPALQAVSRAIGRNLRAASGSDQGSAVSNDPVAVAVVPYRPLPSHTALGLSAFYISLLTIFCGFLGAVIVQTAVDAALGYAPTEIGPRWQQRMPVAISRWQTLLAKWAIGLPVAVILTGVMLGASALILHADLPHFWMLWLLTGFAALVVASGTLVLFAAFGTVGQIAALLVFVYLSLASSGGTVPLAALSGFFRFLAEFEPLRQILDGVRAILYFDARADAGLTRAFVTTSLGLAFWLALGVLVTTWYDRKGLQRMPPELMEGVDEAVSAYDDPDTTPARTPTNAAPDDSSS